MSKRVSNKKGQSRKTPARSRVQLGVRQALASQAYHLDAAARAAAEREAQAMARASMKRNRGFWARAVAAVRKFVGRLR